jgi:hypothetical protein
MADPSCDLWKWHRRLGHLSFDLVSRLSGLDLVGGLPMLKFEKDLVCAPCRHGKMVATHPPLTDVMTERQIELLHMDLVGPTRVRSVGGKWYVLTQNVHLAPNTQQAEQAGFTRAESHETCQSIFPEN